MKKITFLLGRAASGKSAHIFSEVRELKENGSRAILLVPEQFTFETEQRLVNELGGLIGIEVLSFDRLAERVNASAGRDLIPLDRHGLSMLVRKCLLEGKDDLTTFRSAADKPGFAQELAMLYTKFSGAGISAADLTATAGKLPGGTSSLLKEKLVDLGKVFSLLEDNMADRFLTPDDALTKAASALSRSPYAGLPVFIDGFGGSTHAVLTLAGALMDCASQLTVALTMDPFADPSSGREDLFTPDREIFNALMKMAEARQIRAEEILFKEEPECRSAALGFLEKHLFTYSGETYKKQTNDIRLFTDYTRQREADMTAERIIAMIKKTGCRYSDFSILVPDPEAYRIPLEQALQSRSIPAFLDDRTPLATHSLSRFLLSAVRCAAGKYPIADLLTFIKSGYLTFSDEDIDRFENYLLRFSFSPFYAKLKSPFKKESRDSRDREAAEKVRKRITELLLPLEKGLAAPAVSEKVESIYRFLSEARIKEQLESRTLRELDTGKLVSMQVYAQVWNKVVGILDQIELILGETNLDKDTFRSVLEEGFANTNVGVLPEIEDGVLVGDIRKTRLRPVDHLFLLGVSEGVLPRQPGDDGILDNGDIALLQKEGLSGLRGTDRDALLEQRSIYLALTKARKTLTVSYPMNADSTETLPSSLFNELEGFFPNRRDESPVEPESREEALYRYSEALHAASSGAEPGPILVSLEKLFAGDPAAGYMKQAARNDPIVLSLSKDAAEALHKDLHSMSASRLETFNECPFRDFAGHGLHLKERAKAERNYADLGSLYHKALQTFLDLCTEEDRNYASMTDQDCEDLLSRILPPILETESDGFYADPESSLGESILIRLILLRAFKAVRDQFAVGSLKPEAMELKFGKNSPIDPLELTTASGRVLQLNGIIDRVDSVIDPETGNQYLRIIDYKSSKKSYSDKKLREGLILQLPLYLTALKERGLVAGLYYMPIKTALPKETSDKNNEIDLPLAGLTAEDSRFIELSGGKDANLPGIKYKDGECPDKGPAAYEKIKSNMETALRVSEKTADRILSGLIGAFPMKNQCKNCPYSACCGFDATLPVCRERNIGKKADPVQTTLEKAIEDYTGGSHELDN